MLSLSVPALAAEDRVIDSWAWTKNNGLRNGILYLAPAHYMKNDILMRLPGSILINDGQELKVTWDDPDFPAEGVSHGTYDFYVVLPEGYAQGKDCPDIYVRVIIVYPQYEDSGTYRYDSTTGEKGRILSSVGVNGMSGREVTRTTYHADGSSDTVEFKQHENGNTAKIITHTNADGSYTITRYDTEAGAELTSHHAAPKTEGTDPEPTGTETTDTETNS